MKNQSTNTFTFEIKDADTKHVSVIALSGRLMDEESAEDLVVATEERFDADTASFVMNLESLEYINSSGLNNLVNVLTKARSKGGDVVLCNLSEKVKNLFIVTKLNTVFTVTDTEEEALSVLTSEIED